MLGYRLTSFFPSFLKRQDSWGHQEGSLPPMRAAKRSTMPEFLTSSGALVPPGEISDLDDSNYTSGHSGQNLADNRAQSWHAGKKVAQPTDDPNHHANYVNFNKLLTPDSSNYYYTRANRSNRQVLEKVKSKKKINRTASLDESAHSKVSMMSHRSNSSTYRGPIPLKKDGSYIRSAMKRGLSSAQSSSNLDNSEGTGRGLSNSEDTGVSGIRSAGARPEGARKSSSAAAAKGLKRCSFSYIDIREHERVAGDNPCVTSGVPLSIGWGYVQHDPLTLDDYEEYRGPTRDKIEMMVPANVRKDMLRHEFGVSITEMNAAMKEVNVKVTGW